MVSGNPRASTTPAKPTKRNLAHEGQQRQKGARQNPAGRPKSAIHIGAAREARYPRGLT